MKHHKYILVTLSLGISSLALPIALAEPSTSSTTDTSMYSIQTSPPMPTNVCTRLCLPPNATPNCPAQCPSSCTIQQSTDPCCPDSMEAICNSSVSTPTSSRSTSPTITSPSPISSDLTSSSASVSATTSSSQASATVHNNGASTDMASHHALYISTALVAVVFAALLH